MGLDICKLVQQHAQAQCDKVCNAGTETRGLGSSNTAGSKKGLSKRLRADPRKVEQGNEKLEPHQSSLIEPQNREDREESIDPCFVLLSRS